MLDPIGCFQRIRDQYIAYLETAFSIADPEVSAERRRLLETLGQLCTEPLIEPIRPLAKIATFAGPPRICPSRAKARLIKNVPAPVCCKAAPKIRKPITRLAKARMGIPMMLSLLMAW